MEGPVEGVGGTWSRSSPGAWSSVARGSWAGSGVKSAGTVSSVSSSLLAGSAVLARTRIYARAGATVEKHPLSAV
ncbi:hypothetical protein [Streptomyces hirsutus]|uniref:hypothetical protein n=1 Tax=Streptomyces hirsutus TaxID=35620 RepID=UPI0036BA0734